MKHLLGFKTILFRVNEAGKITHRGDYIPNGERELSWSPVGRGDVPSAAEARKRICAWHASFRDRWLRYWNWSEDLEQSPIVPECAAESLCPTYGIGANIFLKELIEYPRFVTSAGDIQVGGLQYVGVPKQTPGITYAQCVAAPEIAYRGAFDDAVRGFLDYVRWLGRCCGCTDKAVVVVGRLGAVVDWIDSCLPDTESAIDELDWRYGALAEALVAMSEAVGRWQPPSKVTVGGGPSQSSEAALPKVASIDMDRICASRRRKPSKKSDLRSDMILFVEECIVKAWRHFTMGDPHRIKNSINKRLQLTRKRTYSQFLRFWGKEYIGTYPCPKVDYYLGNVVRDPMAVKKLVHKYRNWDTARLRGSDRRPCE